MNEIIKDMLPILQLNLDAFNFYIQSPDGQYDTYACKLIQYHMADLVGKLRAELYHLIIVKDVHDIECCAEYKTIQTLLQKCDVAMEEQI